MDHIYCIVYNWHRCYQIFGTLINQYDFIFKRSNSHWLSMFITWIHFSDCENWYFTCTTQSNLCVPYLGEFYYELKWKLEKCSNKKIFKELNLSFICTKCPRISCNVFLVLHLLLLNGLWNIRDKYTIVLNWTGNERRI